MSALFPDGSNFNNDFFQRATAYWQRYGLLSFSAQIDIYHLFDSTFMHEVGIPTVTYMEMQAE